MNDKQKRVIDIINRAIKRHEKLGNLEEARHLTKALEKALERMGIK